MNVLELILGPVTKVLDKIIPDPQAKAVTQLELLKLQQAGEFKELDTQLQLDLGQLGVNKAEAASGNAFASSWQPLCGYVCVLGLAYPVPASAVASLGLRDVGGTANATHRTADVR